jgi:hypothetical protein
LHQLAIISSSEDAGLVGVATGDSDVQTRWLLGLALLVAFVGILTQC